MLQGFEILDCDFVKENKYMKSHWHIKRRVSYNEAELRKTVGIIVVVAMCLLALSYIAGIQKAYLASIGVTEKVSKDIKVEFESVTLSKCSIGSSVSCSWIYGDSVESSAPKLNDIKHGLFSREVYAYPSFPLAVGEKQEGRIGRIVKCGLLYDNKPADCGVYLRYDWGLPVLYAQVDSDRDEEVLGIASCRVRFSGLRSGKAYVFDGKRLDVGEDGTAVAEFDVPHYGYRKAGEDNAYAIPLLEVVDGEQKGLMAVCIKRAEVR